MHKELRSHLSVFCYLIFINFFFVKIYFFAARTREPLTIDQNRQTRLINSQLHGAIWLSVIIMHSQITSFLC
jgi:hypothetical protein